MPSAVRIDIGIHRIQAGGVGFAILIGNMLAPSLDLWIKRYQARKKAAKA